jgi:hypothetical protein
MAHVVCQIADDPPSKGLELVWSEGAGYFEPYRLAGAALDSFDTAVEDARRALVQVVLLSRDGKVESLPGACLELAEAGRVLYEALFEPIGDRDQEIANEVRAWLEGLRDAGLVESLEVLLTATGADRTHAMPRAVPWNVLYDKPPDRDQFGVPGDHPGPWEPFWGVRYNLAVGRKVDPRRRLPYGDRKLHVLFVADPEVLPPDEWAQLQGFAEGQGYPLLRSRAELGEYRTEQPVDVLYCLCHADPSALFLGREPISLVELFRLCKRLFHRQSRGLVVLNACQTAGVGREGSFMEALHSAGASGMVATEECTVNIFANRFGLDFLRAFLVDGKPIGPALQKLRADGGLQLPLGLLYGTYCPPYLCVGRPTPAAPPTTPVPTAVIIAVPTPAGAFLGPQAKPDSVPPLPEHPYRSLAYYEREHRALFTGRDADVERFALMLDEADCCIAVLHGQSGVGKSSFLRAGLIPFLEEECVGYQFLRDRQEGRGEPILFIRSTGDPTGPLAKALCDFCARAETYATPVPGKAPVQVDLPGILGGFVPGAPGPAALRDALRADPTLLGRLLAALAERLPYTLVLVIDQAEEVFTLARTSEDEDSRDRALEMLRRALDAPGRFKVIVSLRTEYYGRLLDALRQDVRSAAAIRDYLLTDLAEGALAEAILRPTATGPIRHASEVPAEKYRFRYAPEVAATIARKVRDYCRGRQDSELPLAQIICTQLYELVRQRPDPAISLEDFASIGGVEGGLHKHVEALVADLLRHPRDRRAFKKLFCRLYRRQPDRLLTTELVREDELAREWTGHISFDAMLKGASRSDRNLLREKTLPDEGGERRYLSLGHDALASVAADWHEKAQVRKKLLRVAGICLGIAVIFAVTSAAAMLGYAMVSNALEGEKQAKQDAIEARKRAETARDNAIREQARGYLRPLLRTKGNLTDAEAEALDLLAELREQDVAKVFLQEALRDGPGRRRLGVRAEYAFHASIGLSLQQREHTEKMLFEVFEAQDVPESEKTDLALAVVALGDLSVSSGAVAQQLARALAQTHDIEHTRELAEALAVLAARMASGEAVRVAAPLVQALEGVWIDPRRVEDLAKAVAALSARMERGQADRHYEIAAKSLVHALGKDWTEPYRRESLAMAVAALADRMEVGRANFFCLHAADSLVSQALKNDRAFQSPDLAKPLAALAARMERREAGRLCAYAARALLERLKKDGLDGYRRASLARAVAVLAARMESEKAGRIRADAARAIVIQDLKDSRSDSLLYSLELEQAVEMLADRTESGEFAQVASLLLPPLQNDRTDPSQRAFFARLVAALAAGMENRKAGECCADAARALVRALKDDKTDPRSLSDLARSVAALAARLESREADRVCAEAAGPLVKALKDATHASDAESLAKALAALAARMGSGEAARMANPLVQALKDDTIKPFQCATPARAVAALAAGMEGEEAARLCAEAAGPLVRALEEGKIDPFWWESVAGALAALAVWMDSREADRLCIDAARPIVQALKDGKIEPLYREKHMATVVALVARMDSKEAGRLCADAAGPLLKALKDTEFNSSFQRGSQAAALAALVARMDSEEAGRLCADAAHSLVRSRFKRTGENLLTGAPVVHLDVSDAYIELLLTGFLPTRTPAKAATVVTSLADSSGLPVTGIAILILVKNPPPCRLSTGQLVDLLKDPLCVGQARRIILNQLEIRYQREFPDHWAFVRFAESELHMDCKGPPQRAD